MKLCYKFILIINKYFFYNFRHRCRGRGRLDSRLLNVNGGPIFQKKKRTSRDIYSKWQRPRYSCHVDIYQKRHQVNIQKPYFEKHISFNCLKKSSESIKILLSVGPRNVLMSEIKTTPALGR